MMNTNAKLVALLSLFGFLTVVSGGCKKAEPPEIKPKAIIKNIADELYKGDTKLLNKHIDWPVVYEKLLKSKTLAREVSQKELYDQFLKGMILMFTPGGVLKTAVFNTKAFCHTNNKCDVFLFDGEPNKSGSINLSFIMERNDDQWKIVDTNFYHYGRWAVTSSAESRKAFRQKMLTQFE